MKKILNIVLASLLAGVLRVWLLVDRGLTEARREEITGILAEYKNKMSSL